MYKELIFYPADENLKSRMEHYAAMHGVNSLNSLLTHHIFPLTLIPLILLFLSILSSLIILHHTLYPQAFCRSYPSPWHLKKKKTEDGIEPPLLSEMTKESGRLPALKCGPLYSRAHWGLETRVIVSLACRTILTSSYSSKILRNIWYFTKRIYNNN